MSKRYIDFAAVKAKVSMLQMLEHYGLTAQMRSVRNGDSYEGRCPIHKGTSADQFKVSISKNCWNCFGECKRGGNTLDFTALMEGVSVQEAAHFLNDRFMLGLLQEEKPPRRGKSALAAKAAGRAQKPESAPPPAAASASNDDRQTKPNDDTAGEPQQTEETGENPPLTFELKNLDPRHPYFTERGLTLETVETFGLGYCSRGTMSGRIVIPLHNAEGKLVAYAGRWPGKPPEGRERYKLPPGFKKSLVFNLHRALPEAPDFPLIVVEGFFGAMHLWQCGFRSVVALMGSHLSPVQEERLITASEKRGKGIVVLFDGDPAGREGRDKAVLRLALRCFVRVATLPREGAQPDHLSSEELQPLLAP